MIIPWRVDVPQERRPFLNWLIIIAAIAAFVFQMKSIDEHEDRLPSKVKEYENHSVEEMVEEFGVDERGLEKIERRVDKFCEKYKKIFPKGEISAELRDDLTKKAILQNYFVWEDVQPFVLDGYSIKGLLGHVWLHGGVIHLLGNLLFLWVFGNAVCSKIGNMAYFPIYILLGILAGLGQLAFDGGAAIGASGAIMGVVGMYLVFFPVNEITCYFVFLFILRPIVQEFTLSSFWMILFWVAFDIYGAAMGGGRVAYFAHLGGFVGGMLLAVLMLKMRLVGVERYEKSLLQIWAERKDEAPKGYGANHGMLPLDFKIHKLETGAIVNEEKKESEPAAVDRLFEIREPDGGLIRFVCGCGKRVKVSRKYAGKRALCPRCKKRVKIPVE